MNGKDYLHKHIEKEELENNICFYCCPNDFGFETAYTSNEELCNGIYQGDCDACWNSVVVKK